MNSAEINSQRMNLGDMESQRAGHEFLLVIPAHPIGPDSENTSLFLGYYHAVDFVKGGGRGLPSSTVAKGDSGSRYGRSSTVACDGFSVMYSTKC
jgi:hypothetical protein